MRVRQEILTLSCSKEHSHGRRRRRGGRATEAAGRDGHVRWRWRSEMFHPASSYLSVNPCETEFCIHALGALSWIFYILSEVSTSCCARWDSLFSLFSLQFHSRWSRSRSWAFFYYTHIHVLTNCKLLLIFIVISEKSFQHLEVLNFIFRAPHAFFGNHQIQSHLFREPSLFHTLPHQNPICSTKSQNKQNLVLMLHFRHLMHAKYSPDPSLVFQKGRVPSLL